LHELGDCACDIILVEFWYALEVEKGIGGTGVERVEIVINHSTLILILKKIN
jgi:hypothetical protein